VKPKRHRGVNVVDEERKDRKAPSKQDNTVDGNNQINQENQNNNSNQNDDQGNRGGYRGNNRGGYRGNNRGGYRGSRGGYRGGRGGYRKDDSDEYQNDNRGDGYREYNDDSLEDQLLDTDFPSLSDKTNPSTEFQKPLWVKQYN